MFPLVEEVLKFANRQKSYSPKSGTFLWPRVYAYGYGEKSDRWSSAAEV